MINPAGGKAVGSGDGSLIVARRARPKRRDPGQVGEVVGVNPELVRALQQQDFIR